LNFLSLYKRRFIYFIKKKINLDKIKTTKKNLEDLFILFGTDKAHFWNSQKNRGHGYTRFYETHLSQFRNKKIKILEIGSYSGASAAAFSKYFNKSKIYCIDINISNFKFYSKKIQVFGLDVSKKNSLENFIKQIGSNREIFDIIIDDGSHKLSDILTSFNFFFNFLKSKSYYIIEDYNFPLYFKHLKDVKDVTINNLIKNNKIKIFFKSKIINNSDQLLLFKNINKVHSYKGNLINSDIVFFKKK